MTPPKPSTRRQFDKPTSTNVFYDPTLAIPVSHPPMLPLHTRLPLTLIRGALYTIAASTMWLMGVFFYSLVRLVRA